MTTKRQSEAPARYVLATPRALRGKVPTVLTRIAALKGVTVEGSGNPDRVIVAAKTAAVAEMEALFGDSIIIEPEAFYPLASEKVDLSRKP